MKIDNILTDWEGLITGETRLPNWTIGAVSTIVGKNDPNRDAKPDVNFSRFGRARLMESSRHCSFDGTDCWTIRVHPKVDSVSAATGYLNGGQTLEIKGWGLQGKTSTTVTIDGVDCAVDPLRSNNEKITCITGKANAVSYSGPQPGQHGLTSRFVNPTDVTVTPTFENSLTGTYPSTVTLATSMDTLWNGVDEKSVNNLDGWFKAPATGNYRFYIAADDQYKLWLDATNPFDKVTPVTTTLVEIGQSNWFKGWRKYVHDNPISSYQGKIVTDWITLQAGKFYKIRGQHRDTGGSMWSNVSVEFQKPNSEAHPMAAPAVQSWRIEQTNVAERWTVTVQNPSAGAYKLAFLYPGTSTNWISASIAANASAATFANAIRGFFSASNRANSNISVTLEMYDAANALTTVTASATKYVYVVKLMKRITGFSFSSVTAAPVGTITSTVTVQPPYGTSGTASSAPMTGNFILSCADSAGVVHDSKPIAYN